ncbi:uncharacterized protein BXZ73DRAFT_92953 [Epithele typhae]|uniref:uncharacterized protein n=1 Tax=Epithele typhae TaxID=378194 RepID=UPI0020072446|nr:uncharacterized protein BXZ73DRAFT_92953 [Epithele typhae]KAH9913456.1 hypothetical protein BXZ73DRAFT_92953 [Epithele typhae]
MPLHDILRQRAQPFTAAITSNRIFLYSVFSTFAVAATVANACREHSNFYSVSIFLSNSSRSVLILANFGFICSILFGRILQKLFFGTLQPREVERLYDQTWMFVTESLLAFTIFRDEFDIPFLLMFGFLLFVKCFHWLVADRVESMDQTNYPGPPTLFHIRINSLFAVLWAVDATMFAIAVESTLSHGVGGMVLFASEYAILLASALNAILRYTLSIIDLRRARTRGGESAPPWENKSMYIFYIELLTDFLKLATYLTFFMIILTFYGLPLNIIRDVFITARSFITRLRALIRYHNATRDMDRRYPDATEAELAVMSDRTCVPEHQQAQAAPPADGPNMTPKKLPCGHIFHFQCLRSWLERQQSCPTWLVPQSPPFSLLMIYDQALGQDQARVARPRPGAAPGAAGPPMGWLGRFLGLPPVVQPPAPPPQFGPGAFPAPGAGAGAALPHPQPFQHQQHQQQHQHHQQPLGWGAPLPPHLAGQIPPPPPPPFYGQGWQHPPPPPHAPPPFRGFYDPAWYAQAAQAAQHAPRHPTHTPTAVDERGPPRPTPTTAAADEATAPPRAAATLAALRRRQLGASASPNATAERESNIVFVPKRRSSSERPPMTAGAAASPASPTSPPAPSRPQLTLPEPHAQGHPPLPALIPLYDPSLVLPPRPAPPYPYTQRAADASRRRPLAELPAALTDAQLARLDALTREAIDERLRVLEGVSGAVYRCVEELTRVRSVLPATQGTAAVTTAPAASSSAVAAAESSSESGEKAKEKEKERELQREGEGEDAGPNVSARDEWSSSGSSDAELVEAAESS